MAVEDYAAQRQLFSQIERAVGSGFVESGLEKAVAADGVALTAGLQAYVTVLLAAFTHREAMHRRYQQERAKVAALAGDYYFDAILGQIQAGDVALFHGGLFFGGVHRLEEAAGAKKAYIDVAVLLRGNRNEHRFFVFLSQNTLPVMDGLGFAATHLNLPRPKESPVILPVLEKYLSRDS